MKTPLNIDFISDVSCGWCASGLHALEEALRHVGPDIAAEFHFLPFELNPGMPAGGENLTDHLNRKYGKNAALQYFAGTQAHGDAAGFEFNFNADSRIYNTFDAHRLLHWAGLIRRQTELTHALFEAHFTHNQDPADHTVLLACAEAAQLDIIEARQILASNRFADDVRELESSVQRRGISAVPTIIINGHHVISGSRSVAAFEQFIRSALNPPAEVAASSTAPSTDVKSK